MACTWDARLKKERQLGGGAFGRAFLVRDSQQSNAQMVLKEIDVCQMPKSEREAAWQEARLLGSLHHPNIVRSYEHFQRQSKLCILMDFCSGGDLEQILKAQNGQLLPESTVLDWFVQIVLGVKHMHDRKVLHRDLKTSNCFICSDGSLKVGDMGVSKILNGTQQLAYTAVGTPYTMSPELCQNKPYSKKTDCWSLGCVLYESLTLRHAFNADCLKSLVLKICRGTYPPVPSSFSEDAKGLVTKLLQKDSTKRPSMNDLLELPIIHERAKRFLPGEVVAEELTHTVLHGKPKPGKLSPPRQRSAPMQEDQRKRLAHEAEQHQPSQQQELEQQQVQQQCGKQQLRSEERQRARPQGNAQNQHHRADGQQLKNAAAAAPKRRQHLMNNIQPQQQQGKRTPQRVGPQQWQQQQQRQQAAAAGMVWEREWREKEAAHRLAKQAEEQKQRERKQIELEERRRQAAERHREEREQRKQEFQARQEQAKRNKQAALQQLRHDNLRDQQQQQQQDASLGDQVGSPNFARAERGEEAPARQYHCRRPSPLPHRQDMRTADGNHELLDQELPPASMHAGEEDHGCQNAERATEQRERRRWERPSPQAQRPALGEALNPLREQTELEEQQQWRQSNAHDVDAPTNQVIEMEERLRIALENRKQALRNRARAMERPEDAEEPRERQASPSPPGSPLPDVTQQPIRDQGEEGKKKPRGAAGGVFVMNGDVVELPGIVDGVEGVAGRIEALRMLLEEKLGLENFKWAYQKLNNLAENDDDDTVQAELRARLGARKMGYLGLLHQLLVAEDHYFMGMCR